MRPFGTTLLAALGPARIATIVAAAIVAGVVAGYALATLSNDSKEHVDTTAVQTVPADTAAGPDGAQVVKAVLMPATTASGKARRRARAEIVVNLRNLSGVTRVPTAPPVLIVHSRRLHIDPAASADAGNLLKPVPALTRVTGTLRFETAGSDTDRLTAERRARLAIAGQTLPVRLTISSIAP
ncbi:MAG TPA: hypothetical protein VHZ75_09925 [Solirubrobacteraceae bacterium]|nr:hypothetical protein [Solirubrobacteraceae bacterium]